MRKTIFSALIAAGLLVVLLNLPVLAQGITNFSSVVLSGDLTVGDDATVADSLSTADIAVSDDATVSDDFTVGGDIVTTPGTAIVVSASSTITPLGAYVPITGSTGVGTSSIAGPTAGRLIYIVNMANATITLTDTGTLKLGGNFAMGQYDSITLRGDGTNWIETGRSNN